ncbi:hypothetical protein ABFV83_00085 [Lacrimispora sp. BS-2]|uniref:Uncharacterized protein n=1 Tax=Lacrimispora sp. BS-2 TaxID=3151850 RepID=A0AAU7PRQ9_9FIRM
MRKEKVLNTLDLSDSDINEYEKTIICIIASYLRVYPVGLDNSQWYDISEFLCIKVDFIEKLLAFANTQNEFGCSHLNINGEIIDLSEYWLSYQIFECLLNYYFIRNCISQVLINNKRASLKSNYQLYQSAKHNMNMMNVCAGAYECFCNQKFSREYAPQSFESFHPDCYIDELEMYLFSDDYFKLNNNMLPIVYRIINYEILSHANSMYLIVIFQILKHSIFYNDITHNIAKELYNNLHLLLKDARVVSVQTNYLFQDTHKSYDKRNRQTDNTTRLHIVYGFDNYDTYSLRLDLSHKGIDWIHYNNNSPGGVKSYYFTQTDYDIIIQDMPDMKKCFINQGNKWYLKEKCNCNLNQEENELFDLIQRRNEHTHVFNTIYSEEDVITFLNEINKFLSNLSAGGIDKTGKNAKYCFNFDKLMSLLELFHVCQVNSDAEGIDKFMKLIVERAIIYDIILPSDKKCFLSNEGIQIIIDLAYDRCYLKKQTL